MRVSVKIPSLFLPDNLGPVGSNRQVLTSRYKSIALRVIFALLSPFRREHGRHNICSINFTFTGADHPDLPTAGVDPMGGLSSRPIPPHRVPRI